MFLRIVFLFLILIIVSCTQTKNVSVTVLAEKQYCGGAKPTPEMVKDLQTPAPYANKTMMLVSDNGKVDSVRTDSEGKANLKLKPGRYKLIEKWRYTKSAPGERDLSGFDKECLVAEWKKINKLVLVTKSGFNTIDSVGIVNYCEWRLPCLSQDGNSPVPD